MAKLPVIPTYRALDDELVKVGKACVSAKALLLAENLHHQFCVRRRGTMAAVYQAGETEVVTPTRYTTIPHTWRYVSGYNSRYFIAHVLTVGATYSYTATDQARLTLATTTGGAEDWAAAGNAPAPTTTLSTQGLQHHHWTVLLTGNTLETAVIDQGGDSAHTRVSILALVCEELPVPTIDPTVDTWAHDPSKWTPGTDIIDTEYDDIATGTAILRRCHKKLMWSLGKAVITTQTAEHDLVAGRDGGGNKLLFDLDTSVNRPETTGTAITVRVYAENSVAVNGTVRFAFSGGNVDVANITTGGPAWYTATGTIVKGAETMYFRGLQAGAGTLTVYSAEVYEDVEAT